MLTLYSYPTLFGVADNNGYGLKVFAFLKLAGVPFRQEHIFDASKAPRSHALLREHPSLTEEGLAKAQANSQRYYYQGIGRYHPDAGMARGLADLGALADLIPSRGYVHGEKPTSVDAGIYGFIANIYFYDIDMPLKQFVTAHDNIVRHCRAIHEAVSGTT
jgi:glutathione S-transferase